MPKFHSPSELREFVTILDTDAETVLDRARGGLQNMSGGRLKDAQLQSAESTHVVTFRTPDARALKASGFLKIGDTVYVIDYPADAYNSGRAPQPNTWLEVFCHAQRSGGLNGN